MREEKQEFSDRTSDDVRAIAAALSLCTFLWILKGLLIGWYVLVKDVHPLADASVLGMVVLGAADLVVCCGLAVGYRIIYAISRRLPPMLGRILRGPVIFLVHAAIVVFSVLSFEVSRVYGWPLEIGHIRSADDPRIITASILAYAGLLPVGLILFGFIAKPAIGGAIAAVMKRIKWLNSPVRLWGTLATCTSVMFGIWYVELKGIDTYGVKDDPLVYFVMHYKPQLKAVDAKDAMLALGADIGDAGRELADPPSLITPKRMLERDFAMSEQAANARGMNVLMIQLESTSASHIDEKTTPNLMRLAKHAVSFRNHATVFSETSRASYGLYFSDYMTDLGTTPRLLYQRPMPRASLANSLQEAGYSTGVFHSGFLSYADLRYLFEQSGFETIVDATNLWSGEEELPWSWGVREEVTVDAIVKWVDQPRTKPFFLIYATEFPHHPYVCPIADKPYPGNNWVDRYRNSLYYADKCIGTLLDQLEQRKLLENTIIVVVGDHGETVSTYPVGHGVAMSREELFTPFIISNPKLFAAAKESKLVTNHLDVAPTLATLVGAKPAGEWLGRDVLAEQIPSRLLFVQAKLAQVQGVLDNGVVYVYEAGRKRSRLYDLADGGFAAVPAGDPRLELLPKYRKQDELFQKWAVWRHMARATGEGHALTSATPHGESARPASATVLPASAAVP